MFFYYKSSEKIRLLTVKNILKKTEIIIYSKKQNNIKN